MPRLCQAWMLGSSLTRRSTPRARTWTSRPACGSSSFEVIAARVDLSGGLAPPPSSALHGEWEFPPLRVVPCIDYSRARCLHQRGSFRFPWIGTWTRRSVLAQPGADPVRASVAYHGAPERFTPAEVQAMETSLTADDLVPPCSAARGGPHAASPLPPLRRGGSSEGRGGGEESGERRVKTREEKRRGERRREARGEERRKERGVETGAERGQERRNALFFFSRPVMSSLVVSCSSLFSCHVTSCVVMSCQVMSRHARFCRVASRGIASCSVRLCRLFSCLGWFVFSRPVRSCRVVFVSCCVRSWHLFLRHVGFVFSRPVMSSALVSCPLFSSHVMCCHIIQGHVIES